MTTISVQIDDVFTKLEENQNKATLDDILVIFRALKEDTTLNTFCKKQNAATGGGSKFQIAGYMDFSEDIRSFSPDYDYTLVDGVQGLIEDTHVFLDPIVREERLADGSPKFFYIDHDTLKKLKAEGVNPFFSFGQLDATDPALPKQHRGQCYVEVTYEFENFILVV